MNRILVTAAFALALTTAPAQAEETVVEDVFAPAPVAAHGDTLVWNAYDPATKRFQLRAKTGDAAPRDLPVADSATALDVDLGIGPNGRTVAVWSRCDGGDCDLEWLDDLDGGTPRPVRGAARATRDETAPSVHRATVTFVTDETVRTTTVSGARRMRRLPAVPRFVRRNNGRKTFGRFELEGLEARGGRVLLVREAPERGGLFSQVLALRSGKWRVLAHTSSGMLTYSRFSTPSFAPGGRAIFGFYRGASSFAPRIVSVRLRGALRARELLLGGRAIPHALDAIGADILLLRQDSEDLDCAVTPEGASRTDAVCHVLRIGAPAYRPADPKGYSLG